MQNHSQKFVRGYRNITRNLAASSFIRYYAMSKNKPVWPYFAVILADNKNGVERVFLATFRGVCKSEALELSKVWDAEVEPYYVHIQKIDSENRAVQSWRKEDNCGYSVWKSLPRQ